MVLKQQQSLGLAVIFLKIAECSGEIFAQFFVSGLQHRLAFRRVFKLLGNNLVDQVA